MSETRDGVSDQVRYEWEGFGRTHWGPATVVVRVNSVEATVGGSTVVLDLTDRRPARERQEQPFRSVFLDGVPVELDGRRVATVSHESGGALGLVRRSREQVTGDASFVLPGLRVTHRGLPLLVTLRCDAGTLVTSRRWGAPLDTLLWELSWFRSHGVVAPKVARDTRPEHVALWLAMREALRA